MPGVLRKVTQQGGSGRSLDLTIGFSLLRKWALDEVSPLGEPHGLISASAGDTR